MHDWVFVSCVCKQIGIINSFFPRVPTAWHGAISLSRTLVTGNVLSVDKNYWQARVQSPSPKEVQGLGLSPKSYGQREGEHGVVCYGHGEHYQRKVLRVWLSEWSCICNPESFPLHRRSQKSKLLGLSLSNPSPVCFFVWMSTFILYFSLMELIFTCFMSGSLHVSAAGWPGPAGQHHRECPHPEHDHDRWGWGSGHHHDNDSLQSLYTAEVKLWVLGIK